MNTLHSDIVYISTTHDTHQTHRHKHKARSKQTVRSATKRKCQGISVEQHMKTRGSKSHSLTQEVKYIFQGCAFITKQHPPTPLTSSSLHGYFPDSRKCVCIMLETLLICTLSNAPQHPFLLSYYSLFTKPTQPDYYYAI